MPLHIERRLASLRHGRRARGHRPRHRRRRDGRADRPVRLRQVALCWASWAACCSRPRGGSRCRARRRPIRSIPSPTSSRISPCCRGAPSRPTWRWRWSIARLGAAERRERVAVGARPHRPHRIRRGLSQAALRRHAPARRHRPRAGRAAGRAAARRAAVGARRADARAADGGSAGDLGAREEHARLRHPQSRGGRAARRPGRRAVAPAGPHPRDPRASTCRWPSAAGPSMPACCSTCIAGCGR